MSSIKKAKKKPVAAAGSAAPADGDAYAALLAQASHHIDEADLEAAGLLYEEALATKPDDVQVLDAAGEIAYLLGDHDRAEELLCRSAELAPSSGYSKWMYLGQLYEGAEAVVAYQKGVQLLQATIDAAPVDAPEKARYRRELSDAFCAVSEIYMTDLCDEDDAEATALACAQKAVEADGENPEAHRVFANVKMCQKDNKAALPHLQKAVALCEACYPDEGEEEDDDEEDGDDDEEGGKASSSGAAGKKKKDAGGTKATATLKAAAAAAAASAKALSSMSSDDLEATVAAAAAAADKTASLPPYDARKELAKACMELELYADALTMLGRLSDEDEADMEVRYLTGEAFYFSGDKEAAMEVLNQADEQLTTAIDRISSLARKEKAKKKGGAMSLGVAAAYETDGLMQLDLSELLSQRKMMRKLKDVVTGAAAPGSVPPEGGFGAAAAAGAGAAGGMAMDS